MLSTLLALTLAGSPMVSSVASPEGPIFTNPATMSSVILRLPLTVSTADECSGAAIPGVTFSRSSSATCTKSDGTVVTLAADKPRVTAAGLLIEGAATNLVLQSSAFDQSPWSTGGTVTANAAVSPDGSTTAERLTDNSSSSVGVQQSITTTSGTAYTFSCYAKADTSTGMRFGNAVLIDGATFTLTDQWARYSATFTASSTSAVMAVYVGSTAADMGSIYVWGCQLETGSIATSYIPTAGTSAARTGDLATVATPVALSTSEGCTKVCVTPLWTGAPAMEGRILDADLTSSNARLLYAPASVDAVRSYNGTTFPAVTAGFTSGTQRCYITRWSVAANSLKVERLDNSTNNSVTFGGFSSFDSTIGLGSRTNGASPANAAISDIQFGRTPGACQ